MNVQLLGPSLIALCAAAFAWAGCGTDISVFTTGQGGGTASSSSGQGAGTTSSQGGTTTSTSSSSSGQGGSSSSSSSGQGGGGPGCAHDICIEAGALTSGCSDCVTQICNADQFCCNNQWDQMCVAEVWSICQIDCAPNLVLCDAQYAGGTQGYYLCMQTPDICDFGFNNTQSSCAEVCADHGGECQAMYNNNGQCGHSQQNYGCNYTGFQTAICVCSRGCGGGPPCGNGQTCQNGQCQ